MSDMGTFRVGIAIQHPARGGTEERIDDVLVDTGSEITWIPTPVLESLGVARERLQRLIFAEAVLTIRRLGCKQDDVKCLCVRESRYPVSVRRSTEVVRGIRTAEVSLRSALGRSLAVLPFLFSLSCQATGASAPAPEGA